MKNAMVLLLIVALGSVLSAPAFAQESGSRSTHLTICAQPGDGQASDSQLAYSACKILSASSRTYDVYDYASQRRSRVEIGKVLSVRQGARVMIGQLVAAGCDGFSACPSESSLLLCRVMSFSGNDVDVSCAVDDLTVSADRIFSIL